MHYCTSTQPHTPCAFTSAPWPYPPPNSTDKPQCPMTPNHKTRANQIKPINCISLEDTNTNTKKQLIVSHQHQWIKPKTGANIDKVIKTKVKLTNYSSNIKEKEKERESYKERGRDNHFINSFSFFSLQTSDKERERQRVSKTPQQKVQSEWANP